MTQAAAPHKADQLTKQCLIDSICSLANHYVSQSVSQNYHREDYVSRIYGLSQLAFRLHLPNEFLALLHKAYFAAHDCLLIEPISFSFQSGDEVSR